ncbi:FKBP-type peptidyl-prolyl cis-trans isomerase [Pedobacter sp.]|uniref:FKBP-type peptidyl-prolyl cis-trans isomerase n=1 Tax=Pedobacter sp. TaxID=1411316 RepID=UPI003D7FAC3D
MKNKIILAAFALLLTFSACQKEEAYDREAQLKADTEIIQKFIVDQKLEDVKESNGLFYQILKPGTGTVPVKVTDDVTVKYEARLLDGTVVDKTNTDAVSFPLSGVIEGWQKGIPLIKAGGKIRLIIPSTMAYTNRKVGAIPANSPLDFTVDLISVNKESN